MHSSHVVILFDAPNKTYYPGDTVSGTVIVNNAKPLKTDFGWIRWTGGSVTKFSILEQATRREWFHGYKEIWFSKDGTMPAGIHNFHFSFVIPKFPCLQPTYKDSKTKNVYKVAVKIVREWFNINVEKEFKVHPYLEKKETFSDSCLSKRFRSGIFFNNGPITMEIEPRNVVYQPGQTINIPVTIINNSFTTVKTIYAALFKEAHHRSQKYQAGSYIRNYWGEEEFPHSFRLPYIGEFVRVDANVDPHSKKTLQVSINIPEDEASTPNFDNGFVKFGYFVDVRFRVENSVPWQHTAFNVLIGKEKKIDVSQAKIPTSDS